MRIGLHYHVIKIKIKLFNSRIWDLTDDYINNLSKIEVCAVFYSHVIGVVFHPNV